MSPDWLVGDWEARQVTRVDGQRTVYRRGTRRASDARFWRKVMNPLSVLAMLLVAATGFCNGDTESLLCTERDNLLPANPNILPDVLEILREDGASTILICVTTGESRANLLDQRRTVAEVVVRFDESHDAQVEVEFVEVEFVRVFEEIKPPLGDWRIAEGQRVDRLPTYVSPDSTAPWTVKTMIDQISQGILHRRPESLDYRVGIAPALPEAGWIR